MRLTVFVFLFFSHLSNLMATHIVGGEITYKCLGNDLYRVRLTVYRDCYNGEPWFDDPASVGIYDKDWNLVGELPIEVIDSDNDTLPIILSNPCLVAPPNVCVHRMTYDGVVELRVKDGGYTVVYQRCCRNTLIRNIINPLATGASFIAEISKRALQECNTSAVFNNWPPVAICVHEPIDFDHSASDADGDSLVYRLCTPLTGASEMFPIPQPPNPGPYQQITWKNPYNISNMLGGDPLTIDPATGFLTGVPNTLGNFVVGICVDEFRDGQILSTTRRDFQYNVADCGQPVAAFFAPAVVCDTLRVAFENQSTTANIYKWYFDLEGNPELTSTLQNPVFVYPDTGSYLVALIAGTEGACSDTVYQIIHLTRSTANAQIDIDFPDCNETGAVLHVTDLSSDPANGIQAWKWRLTGPNNTLLQSTVQNPDFILAHSGVYQLMLTVTSGNGCTNTLTLPLESPYPPVDLLADSLAICTGESIALFPSADPDFTYTWSPDEDISDPHASNPLASPDSTRVYTVSISGNGPCVIQKQVKVAVLNPGALVVTATPDIILAGGSSQLEATFPGATGFVWEPPASLSNPDIYNPVATPVDSTTYHVMALLSSGCDVSGMVTVRVLYPECGEPYIFFPTAFSPNGDNENDVLKLESSYVKDVYWMVYNRFGEKLFEAFGPDDAWDGTYKGVPQPAETYGYYLRVRCANERELIRKGNITLLR
ncbi:MAG: gliding motility-associated C-terminal domain-containing protein [Bacteroidetes bacterium]|nr:gliding motility-associated C-terminal domain-containing protein [Bacteroidota bacterium]